MAIKYYEKYPQRWESPSQDYPQGAFKNLSALGEQDGSYLEKDWLNDKSGFFGALLRNAEMTPNGLIDTAQKSQFYDALLVCARKAVDLSGYYTKTQVDDEILANKTVVVQEGGDSLEKTLSQTYSTVNYGYGLSGNPLYEVGNISHALLDVINDYDRIIITDNTRVVINHLNYTTILSNINKLEIIGSLELYIEAGVYEMVEPLVLSNPNFKNLKITGVNAVEIPVVNYVSKSGVAGNYSVVLNVGNASPYEVGRFLHISDFKGDEGAEIIRGAWEIIGKTADSITIKHTSWHDFPSSFNVSLHNVYYLSTVLSFKNCDGLVVYNSTLDMLDNIAIKGNSDEYWMSSNVTGTEKGTHGIYIGGVTIAVNGKIDSVNKGGISKGHVTGGRFVAINGFDQQGLCVELSGTYYGDFICSSNNKRRGVYVSTAAGIRAKHLSANGNFLDGVITDIGGNIYTSSNSTASGNGQTGFSATSEGSVVADTATALYNREGFKSVSLGFLQATNSFAYKNTSNGYYSGYSSCLYIDRSISKGCNIGVKLDGSTARMTWVTSTENTTGVMVDLDGYAFASGAIIENNGTNIAMIQGVYRDNTRYLGGATHQRSSYLKNIDTNKGVSLTPTSGGDSLVISYDTDGTGSYSQSYNIRPHELYNINEGSVGRPANRFSDIYLVNAPNVISDINQKDDIDYDLCPLFKVMSKLKYCSYRLKEAKEKKGDKARYHLGVIAQDVIQAFESEGLDPFEYGIVCFDSWGAEYDDKGELLKKAGEMYSIRYDELLVLESAYQRHLIEKLLNNR